MRRERKKLGVAPRALTLALSVTLIAGCFGNRPIPEVDKIVEVPEQYTAPTADKPALDRWCSDFGDPKLDELVSTAFEQNLNLRSTWARLEQSEAVLRQTNSNMWPSVDATGQYTANRQPFLGGQADVNIPGIDTGPNIISNYNVKLGAAYEIDLWGKLKAQREAAELDYRASRQDVETIALSLTSQVAEAWFDVLAQRQKRALIEEQLELNKKYVELLRFRQAQGSATALDTNQQLQQIKLLEGQLHTVDQARVLAEQRLAILIGRPPSQGGDLVSAGVLELPDLPELPGTGVPADLLTRRPDLRAAQIRLEAANKRIAVAVRQRLPSIRLSLSTFLQAIEVVNLVEDIFWSVAASVSQPVFNGGRDAAEVERAEAAQKEASLTYANTLLTALGEVENALVAEHYQGMFIAQLVEQRELAHANLELAQGRYSSGGLDFLRVLTSLQSLQQIEQNLVDAERRQLSNRIQLCRALGGTWTSELSAPARDNTEE